MDFAEGSYFVRDGPNSPMTNAKAQVLDSVLPSMLFFKLVRLTCCKASNTRWRWTMWASHEGLNIKMSSIYGTAVLHTPQGFVHNFLERGGGPVKAERHFGKLI